MTEPRTIGYRLMFDGDAVPLAGTMTIGRHLDNDLVIAGEDVLDFHLRIEVPARGPIVVPLDDALIHLNDTPLDRPAGIMPGDRIEIGQIVLELQADSPEAPEADVWRLYPAGDTEGRAIRGGMLIGRDQHSDLRLADPHASRHHARLVDVGGSVWLQDLGSANGTYINGERIRGARRVFHGDEIRFDQLTCQLLGEGADLTPARTPSAGDRRPITGSEDRGAQGEGRDTLEFAAIIRGARPTPPADDTIDAGAYLVSGASLPGSGWYRLPMGRTVIGRHGACDLQLRDRTISGRHAELILRPEGATLTDLMSTNGTFCNERRVQSVRLKEGDRIQIGRMDLVYREITRRAPRHRWLSWIVGLGLLAAAGTALLLRL